MIIATAGHVDHGKTLLVQSLTGVDTDRLEEEKARGLTIDLGFAYMDCDSGVRLGFIDVPGHIRFISNMLAGVGAIDYALLVVAADDGPMPQTFEHLAILDLLNVRYGAVALTKIDRVNNERVTQVQSRIREILASTLLRSIRIFPVSALTGAGMDKLASVLESDAGLIRRKQPSGHFRLAIDRCFTIKGAGVVVTGSVFSGNVKPGEELYLQPLNIPVRVRGLHTQNQTATEASEGDRCAINIAGASVRKDIIHRGNWLTSNKDQCVTDRFDVSILVLNTGARELRHWTPVHVHTAASDVTGRLATLEGPAIPAGERGLVQLITSDPLVLCVNDRVIIRDQAAERTIGGGIVVNIESPRRGRARPKRINLLRSIAGKDGPSVLEYLLSHEDKGIPAGYWRNSLNLQEDEFQQMVQQAGALNLNDEWLISSKHYRLLVDQVLNQFKHNASGLTRRQLAKAVDVSNATLLSHIIKTLVGEKKLKQEGNQLSLPEHREQLTKQEQQVWLRVKPVLEQNMIRPPVLHDLAKTMSMPEKSLEKVLIRCVLTGNLTRPVKNRFFLPAAIDQLRQLLIDTADEDNQLTVRQYRDATGIGRNLAIEILEYFDRQGMTRRYGDIRKILQKS